MRAYDTAGKYDIVIHWPATATWSNEVLRKIKLEIFEIIIKKVENKIRDSILGIIEKYFRLK